MAAAQAATLCAVAQRHVEAGEYAQARDKLIECLDSNPGYAPAFEQLGRLMARLGLRDEALACLRQAAALIEGRFEDCVRLAAAFAEVSAHVEAADQYRRALDAEPRSVGAWNNLGLALEAVGESGAAEQAYRSGLRIDPVCAEAHANLAALLQAEDRYQEALRHYREAVRARPEWPEAWNNLGVVARALGEHTEGVGALRTAARLRPGYVQAHYNLGNALVAGGAPEEARAAYAEALACDPRHAESLYSLGTLATDPIEAAALHERALAVRPDFPEALVALLAARLKACEWTDLDRLKARIEDLVRTRPQAAVAPFHFLQICEDPTLQLECARNWARQRVLPVARRFAPLPPRLPSAARPRRLPIAYLSPDFRQHAVGNLVADLFACHDRSRFEVFAYSSGPDDGSRARRTVQDGAEHFTDVRGWGPRRLAEEIRAREVAIVVDLGGYTEHSLSDALTLRPAPIQVSYLGFPGSMGAPFIDYIVADRHLLPPEQASCYDEQPVYLPDCYQLSPPLTLHESAASRSSLGLPERGFVFCCFNQTYKLRPTTFDIWMRVLQRVPGSVLWLAAFADAAQSRLREAAAARGVDPARLVFAPIVTPEDHAQRLPAADLFLDTVPYSAGATASQTLRAGVPILALYGSTYVGRMSTSLLHAVGLPELVCTDLAQYEDRAVQLATDSAAYRAIRQRVRAGAQRLPPAARFARDLERAFERMWATWAAGRKPGPIALNP